MPIATISHGRPIGRFVSGALQLGIDDFELWHF